jgi:uncharacterized repeat protein (TIGR03803 family)
MKSFMKIHIENRIVTLVMIAGLALIPAGRMTAQTFTTLCSFTNGDGSYYLGNHLVLSGNTLYGTTASDGGGLHGTVFAVNTNGTGFTNLYNFVTSGNGGYNPVGGLILSGDTLYGTAQKGGSGGWGTVFAVKTNGTSFTILHSFAGWPNDGAFPQASLLLSGNTLYGTTSGGGSNLVGTVFAVTTSAGFTNLYNFTGGVGGNPPSGLILSGNTLYGEDAIDNDIVFSINTNGLNFTQYGNGGISYPQGGVILSGNTLYGTTQYGGANGNGSVFAINTNFTGFTNLYSFTNGNDGANPVTGLILSGNTLYGTAQNGGANGLGTVFAVNTNGTGFANLYSFGVGNSGYNPVGGLILSGNTLYGTTMNGGVNGHGTVFSITLPTPPSPPLNIASFGNQSIFFWPTSATNYVLQTTTNLSSPYWITVSNGISVIAVTLTNNLPAVFFRLQQQ